MSSISSWIFSIVCVAVFSGISDIILPQGEISKYIKMTMAIVIVYIIVSPIGSILSSGDLKGLVVSDMPIQSDLMYSINKSKVESMTDQIQSELVSNGYSGARVEINADLFSTELEIITIFVDLSEVVLNPEKQNIDKYTEVRKIVTSLCDIEEENILLYG